MPADTTAERVLLGLAELFAVAVLAAIAALLRAHLRSQSQPQRELGSFAVTSSETQTEINE